MDNDKRQIEDLEQVFEVITGMSMSSALQKFADGDESEVVAEIAANVRQQSKMNDPFYAGIREMALKGDTNAMRVLVEDAKRGTR